MAKNKISIEFFVMTISMIFMKDLCILLLLGYLGTEKQFNHRYARPILNSRDPKCSVKDQV